jgi:sterol desaturase/sphingolipid hydroxylase (fatty acid hydroxylase superfamily)
MAKNFISNNDESVPMFSNRYMDVFTKVHYSVPLIIFIPVIAYFFYLSFFVYHIFAVYGILLAAGGLLVWSLTEYNMHRFVFHWVPPGRWGQQLNFMFHGVHHAYPRDSMRLVMVPVVSIPLAILFYTIFRLTLGPVYCAPFFAGFVIGYLVYDMSHYALHHVSFRSKFWLELKQHHMAHHYSDPDHGYGVSTKMWDHVYKTTFKRKNGGPVVVNQPIETDHASTLQQKI